jgi:hypothetical protein
VPYKKLTVKITTLLNILLLLSVSSFADPEPALIQSICEIELKNGMIFRGYMCIGVDKIATDGFYFLYKDKAHPYSYPVQFKQAMTCINLETGTTYTIDGSSGYAHFDKPTIYYFKDFRYNSRVMRRY